MEGAAVAGVNALDPLTPVLPRRLRSHARGKTPAVESQTEPLRLVVARRATVGRLHLASVARVAACFWSCIGLLSFGALATMYGVLRGGGYVSNAERFVADTTGLEQFRVVSGAVLLGLALALALLVLGGVVFTVVSAAFYNALARIVGGVTVTMYEAAPARGVPADGRNDVVNDGRRDGAGDAATRDAGAEPEARPAS
jgi:hypothetical protein